MGVGGGGEGEEEQEEGGKRKKKRRKKGMREWEVDEAIERGVGKRRRNGWRWGRGWEEGEVGGN